MYFKQLKDSIAKSYQLLPTLNTNMKDLVKDDKRFKDQIFYYKKYDENTKTNLKNSKQTVSGNISNYNSNINKYRTIGEKKMFEDLEKSGILNSFLTRGGEKVLGWLEKNAFIRTKGLIYAEHKDNEKLKQTGRIKNVYYIYQFHSLLQSLQDVIDHKKIRGEVKYTGKKTKIVEKYPTLEYINLMNKEINEGRFDKTPKRLRQLGILPKYEGKGRTPDEIKVDNGIVEYLREAMPNQYQLEYLRKTWQVDRLRKLEQKMPKKKRQEEQKKLFEDPKITLSNYKKYMDDFKKVEREVDIKKVSPNLIKFMERFFPETTKLILDLPKMDQKKCFDTFIFTLNRGDNLLAIKDLYTSINLVLYDLKTDIISKKEKKEGVLKSLLDAFSRDRKKFFEIYPKMLYFTMLDTAYLSLYTAKDTSSYIISTKLMNAIENIKFLYKARFIGDKELYELALETEEILDENLGILNDKDKAKTEEGKNAVKLLTNNALKLYKMIKNHKYSEGVPFKNMRAIFEKIEREEFDIKDTKDIKSEKIKQLKIDQYLTSKEQSKEKIEEKRFIQSNKELQLYKFLPWIKKGTKIHQIQRNNYNAQYLNLNYKSDAFMNLLTDILPETMKFLLPEDINNRPSITKNSLLPKASFNKVRNFLKKDTKELIFQFIDK
ncbi:hypothetical protein ACFL5N_02930, partial [bacterium]